jgi:hypothetical protein
MYTRELLGVNLEEGACNGAAEIGRESPSEG